VRELIVDSFAGGGGASTGIEWALGRSPDIAINHDPEAVAMHAVNHPATRHYCEDVWQVDPVEATGGKPVGLAWFSPDCTHFSKAKGGKPRSKKIRGLAWIVYRWAKAVRPRVICLENVEEFADWGPLLEDGRPCPIRRGMTFRRWWRQLENLGYTLDARELRACDYGAPTSRKRLFVIARCDGQPIQWPEPTHGYGLQAYRTAAECIDWDIPCPSIFDRPKPLADATLRRVAAGVMRYVVNARQPFLVMSLDHQSSGPTGGLAGADEPVTTITAKARHCLISPTLIQTGYGERPGQAPRVPGLDKPLGTCVSGQKHALVAAFLAKHYGGVVGQRMDQTLGTITAKDHHSLVTAFLLKYYGTNQDPRLREPLHTITSKDRFGLVTVHGEPHYIADIGMRMLQPPELFKAQGFPDSVQLIGTKTSQVRLCGNSVSPPVAEAIVRANFIEQRQRVAA
jgi:DNA (cytosine-5)-methyltransferase 1